MTELTKEFTATLQKSPNKGGWTFVVMPNSAEYFGTRGLVKVSGTAISKEAGDRVTVVLEHRLDD